MRAAVVLVAALVVPMIAAGQITCNASSLVPSIVRVDGKTDYQAPGLGYLTVLTRYETCNVKVGAKDLGYPPITKLPLVVGQYKVDIVCAGGQSPNGVFITIAPNATAVARIQ